MDDSEGDCYHDEGFPSQLAPGAWSLAPAGQEGEQGSADSLPDLVLSATVLSPTTQELLDRLDLTGSLSEDLEQEYLGPGLQVLVGEDRATVRFSNPSNPKVHTAARYRSYLNIYRHEDELDGDCVAQKFTSLGAGRQLEQRKLWEEELAIVQGQVQGLEVELRQKARHALQLKRRLGLTAWREFSGDMAEGLERVRARAAPALARLGGVVTEWEQGWAGLRAKARSELQQAGSAAQAEVRRAERNLRSRGLLQPAPEYRAPGGEEAEYRPVGGEVHTNTMAAIAGCRLVVEGD